MVVLYAEASRSSGLEAYPCVVVAGWTGNTTVAPITLSVFRKKLVPVTSSMPAGVVLPIPTLPPDSKMAEFSMLQAVVNFVIWFAVAVPSLVMDEQDVCGAWVREPEIGGSRIWGAGCVFAEPGAEEGRLSART